MGATHSDVASLPNHHKTVRAARRLDCKRSEIVGSLHCLWSWAIVNAPDGDLTGFEPSEIAEAADWPGLGADLIAALIDCGKLKPGAAGERGEREAGFLEVDAAGRLLLHDWEDHGGRLVRHRQQDAYRKWCSRAGLPQNEETLAAWKSGRQARAAAAATAAEKTESEQERPALVTPAKPAAATTVPIVKEQPAAATAEPVPVDQLTDADFFERAKVDYPPEQHPQLWQRVNEKRKSATVNPDRLARLALMDEYRKRPPGSVDSRRGATVAVPQGTGPPGRDSPPSRARQGKIYR